MQNRPSRKEKRKEKGNTQPVENAFKLLDVRPKTDNQSLVFSSWRAGKTPFMHGLPGTGKTFVALYLALKAVLVDKTHRKVIIVRSTVPTRDIGHLPGSAAEKVKAYEQPYMLIATELFGRADAYEILKTKKLVEFIPTSFIRGVTLNDCIIVVDETQNMGYQEVRSVFTRVGENSRMIYCADKSQDDLTSVRFKEESGIEQFMRIMRKIDEVSFVEFGVDDILRNDIIKKFIIAEYGLDDSTGAALASLPMFAGRDQTLSA
jgi:phosphate starvation-inducible protein PhoH